MKKLPLLLAALLGWCAMPALLSADTQPTTTKPPSQPVTLKQTTAVPTPNPKTTTPPAAATGKPDAKPEEKELPIVGKLLDRPGGGYLNLKVDGGHWVLRFLDDKKKEIKADVPRASVRYRKGLKSSIYILSGSGGGKSLSAPQNVDTRPLNIPGLSLVLLKGEAEEGNESYVIFFKQPLAGDDAVIPADEMTPEQQKKVTKTK
jgi:hypothetical protein